jgi:hypothetical protein
MGYATTPGRSEKQQADWFARAVSTFLADPEIEYVGLYKIKDLRPSQHSLGGDANYHLGLTYPNRRKKMAFHTVRMLSGLLNVGTLTVADGKAQVRVTSGKESELYRHLFKRPDGSQVLFVYDKKSTPTVEITLQTSGRLARAYRLDGKSMPYRDFDGRTLWNVGLSPGNISVFKIVP